MPFRHAHWWVLGTFPLAGLAFWRNYLSILGDAPIEYHVHGVTASLWLALLVWQSWSIHCQKRDLHRATGRMSFAFFPLFLAGGVLVLIPEARLYVDQAGPFYSRFPPRLAWVDILAVGGMSFFYYQALRHRRNPASHGGYLLASAVMLLSPIFGRLLPVPLGIDLSTARGFDELDKAFHLGNLLAALVAFIVALRVRGKAKQPFWLAGLLMVASTIAFEWPGGSAIWSAMFVKIAELPSGIVALVAMLVGLAIGWAGWRAGSPKARERMLTRV